MILGKEYPPGEDTAEQHISVYFSTSCSIPVMGQVTYQHTGKEDRVYLVVKRD